MMNTQLPQAFIFDLNGTMIDDMAYHTQAWHAILNGELGARLSLEDVKKEMYGKNEELLVRVFGPGYFSERDMQRIAGEKEARYQQAFRPHLRLIAGLHAFLEAAHRSGLRLAIGSAAIKANIDFVLDGLNIRHYFSAIVSAGDVAQSKPDPHTFLKAAQLLGVAPQQCLVFEDAPKGVEAAHNAGMEAIAITTMHLASEFASYSNIRLFIADYTDPALYQLLLEPNAAPAVAETQKLV